MYIIIIIKINCVLFCFSYGEIKKKHIESWYLRIKNCVNVISKIIYISKFMKLWQKPQFMFKIID